MYLWREVHLDEVKGLHEQLLVKLLWHSYCCTCYCGHHPLPDVFTPLDTPHPAQQEELFGLGPIVQQAYEQYAMCMRREINAWIDHFNHMRDSWKVR